MATKSAALTQSVTSGFDMFEISLSWVNGFFQVAVYSAVVVVILWVMSKIEIKEKGERK